MHISAICSKLNFHLGPTTHVVGSPHLYVCSQTVHVLASPYIVASSWVGMYVYRPGLMLHKSPDCFSLIIAILVRICSSYIYYSGLTGCSYYYPCIHCSFSHILFHRTYTHSCTLWRWVHVVPVALLTDLVNVHLPSIVVALR